MGSPIVIAVDAMGGDKAPDIVIDGIARFLKKHTEVFFLLYGNESVLTPLLKQYKVKSDFYKIHHTVATVKADEKPSHAIRNGRESSMWKAIMSVRNGYAKAIVSAGNTGALMAMSKICLGTLAGIDRPAIAGIIPTLSGASVALDLGANAECGSQNLVEFSIMGTAVGRVILKKENPTVGLLNIGSEETKGRDEIKEAASVLKEMGDKINFKGFVEGNDIGMGTTDVIVSDGFSGNIALKTIEGTAKFISQTLKRIIKRSFFSKLGFLLAIPALNRLKKEVDHRRYNGAMFVGLNGISVKSHGGADAVAFFFALEHAYDMAKNDLCNQIKKDLEKIMDTPMLETECPPEK